MAKSFYTLEIEVDEALINDMAKAVIPGIIRQCVQTVRARCGFIGQEALRVQLTLGGYSDNGKWRDDRISLEEEDTHE